MKKRLASVLLAAVTVSSALTRPVSAEKADEKRERNGSFYSYSFEQLENAEVLNSSFEFSHPVYSADTGGFSCKWDKIYNTIAEVGWGMPEQYAGKNYRAFGELKMTYDADFYTDGNGFFGVHGQTQSPAAEYYIVEGWGSWRPPSGQGFRGTVTVNGAAYDLYRTVREVNSVDHNTEYVTYWCVRQENSVTEGVQNRVTGTVDIYGIFSEWEKAGLNMSGKIVSCGLFAEGYGGSKGESSGSFTVHSASRTWKSALADQAVTDWFLTDTPSAAAGDANCDGVVDVSDAVLVMRYAVADREAVISEQGLKNADTDKNGNTDSDDATNILLHIAKKINLIK